MGHQRGRGDLHAAPGSCCQRVGLVFVGSGFRAHDDRAVPGVVDGRATSALRAARSCVRCGIAPVAMSVWRHGCDHPPSRLGQSCPGSAASRGALSGLREQQRIVAKHMASRHELEPGEPSQGTGAGAVPLLRDGWSVSASGSHQAAGREGRAGITAAVDPSAAAGRPGGVQTLSGAGGCLLAVDDGGTRSGDGPGASPSAASASPAGGTRPRWQGWNVSAPLAPRELRLSAAMCSVLRLAERGDSLYSGCTGRSEHGARVLTIRSLVRRGLIDGRTERLTRAGQAALPQPSPRWL